ncbi:MAG: hypothetical protein H6719_27665 [Sandaracinaceae bacterium]|nr:hypothetical protein [Sandaracinaceae bacterium]
MRYFEASGDRVAIRESARDRLTRGALWLFVAPSLVAATGWTGYGLFVEERSVGLLLVTGGVVALGCVGPALFGLYTMATANRTAHARRVVFDLGERLVERRGAAPAVYRKPDAVRVARAGLLGWTLRLDGETPMTLVRRVPHGSGRALAEAADALAEALGVEARVPAAARTAMGAIPHDEDTWAALCYLPLDGVNFAYCLMALLSSRHPRLRFAAKQSLVQLAVEAFLAACLSGCLGIPLVAASAPFAVEAAAFLCPFTIFGALRVTVRLTAALRAYRKTAWVMPWLGPIVRRWAPAPREAS